MRFVERGRFAAFALSATLAAAPLSTLGCGGPPAPGAAAAPLPPDEVHAEPNRPPLALVPREGDPAGAFAVAVSLEGIAPTRSAELALALATVLEERLRAAWPAVESRPAFESFELRGVVPDAGVEPLVAAVERAMKTPIAAADLEAAKRRLASLAKKPLPDPALRDVARCRGEAFASAPKGATAPELTLADLEAARASAFALGRVAFAIVGPPDLTKRAARAVSRMEPWRASAHGVAPAASAATAATVVETPGLLAPRVAKAHVFVRATDAARAVAAARSLGVPGSPLLARTAGMEGAPRIEEITGTASLAGGCIAVSLDFGAVDLAAPATTSRIASALALVGQETMATLNETASPAALGRTLARQAADPREAAERAAWWTLLDTSRAADPTLVPREESSPRAVVVYGTPKDKPTPPEAAKALEAATERAAEAFQKPALQAKTRVERGQAELWMLFASPCGTGAEVATDAGLAAAFARASVEAQAGASTGVTLEPWTTPDAIGVVAHAPALAGEAPAAHARRIADAAARAFAADPVDERAAARVRAWLRAHVNDPRPRALFALADAAAPGHPSWLVAEGNPDALARVSVASLATRAAALREGPLRAAILANVDDAQAQVAARAADRWIARRPEGVRACPMPNSGAPPRPGTYAVEAPGLSEVYLAFPLEPAQRDAGEWIAETLDGDGGLLATALLAAGLARSATARVVGGPFANALVVHVASSEGALDAAVAQVRALFDRARHGAISDAELANAVARRSAREARSALDPRARLAALFADRAASAAPPTSAALTTAAQSILREESLIVVALRPPRPRTPS